MFKVSAEKSEMAFKAEYGEYRKAIAGEELNEETMNDSIKAKLQQKHQ